ncbi:uncharacterized protein N7511_004837 [Penicillium nucicola]|uniref:uncharacterized protein n=1 Tax=Penicillium nucicola TaxID=1850975 RepID=UPI002544F2AD|nr:uncharacterized protein N7511_004837 [Penicillium nucicola]KAJ5767221.1 hypothetical protein N7511_004837 [Penicillium nucicola]
MISRYSAWEPQGRALQRWTSDPNATGCPIPRTTLTLASLDSQIWQNIYKVTTLPLLYRAWIGPLDLPLEEFASVIPLSHCNLYAIRSSESSRTLWLGRTAPGVIFIEDIYHQRSAPGPWISDLTKAVYENNFPLSSLRYIFFFNVVNPDTDQAARSVFDACQPLGSLNNSPFTWTAPSAEFHALLGSRLGKMVSYFILGAYGQGIKCVVRIITFHTQSARRELHLRFDIEDV